MPTFYQSQADRPERPRDLPARAPSAVAEEGPSRIRDQIALGEKLLTAVADAIAQLEQRLDAVLAPVAILTSAPHPGAVATTVLEELPRAEGPEEPIGGATVTVAAPVVSPIAARLGLLNGSITLVEQRLRDLGRRVDI